MAAADTQIRQPFNLSLPIEDFFKQFDETQDLCTAGELQYIMMAANNGFGDHQQTKHGPISGYTSRTSIVISMKCSQLQHKQ
eukprot:75937-Ditylum_brightwellii.AAC.1